MAAKQSTYTVANGRTVVTEKGDNGPGSKVVLDAEEAERLIARGFLLDESGTVTISSSGPAVNVVDGVQVTPG